MAQAFSKLERWLVKMGVGAETEVLRRERYAVGLMRSQLVPEFKLFLDMSKPQNTIDFEALVRQWFCLSTGSDPYSQLNKSMGPSFLFMG